MLFVQSNPYANYLESRPKTKSAYYGHFERDLDGGLRPRQRATHRQTLPRSGGGGGGSDPNWGVSNLAAPPMLPGPPMQVPERTDKTFKCYTWVTQ